MSKTSVPRTESIVSIGPELAREWLKTSRGNRLISEPDVEMWARSMEAGAWQPDLDYIGFDEEGRLCDGHHRLTAVVTSGLTIKNRVRWGMTEAEIRARDTGRPRSFSDVLRMEEKEKNARLLQAMIRGFFLAQGKSRNFKLAIFEQQETLAKYGRRFRSIIEAHGVGGRAHVLGALAYAWPADPEGMLEFARKFRTGEDLSRGSPILVLRETLILNKGNRRASNAASLTLVAAHKFVTGQSIDLIRKNQIPPARQFFATFYEGAIK